MKRTGRGNLDPDSDLGGAEPTGMRGPVRWRCKRWLLLAGLVAAGVLTLVLAPRAATWPAKWRHYQAVNAFDAGLVMERNGDIEEAILLYDEAIRILPGFIDAYRRRGLCREMLGEHEMAEGDLLMARQIYLGVYPWREEEN